MDRDTLKSVDWLPFWGVALFVMSTSTAAWRWENVA